MKHAFDEVAELHRGDVADDPRSVSQLGETGIDAIATRSALSRQQGVLIAMVLTFGWLTHRCRPPAGRGVGTRALRAAGVRRAGLGLGRLGHVQAMLLAFILCMLIVVAGQRLRTARASACQGSSVSNSSSSDPLVLAEQRCDASFWGSSRFDVTLEQSTRACSTPWNNVLAVTAQSLPASIPARAAIPPRRDRSRSRPRGPAPTHVRPAEEPVDGGTIHQQLLRQHRIDDATGRGSSAVQRAWRRRTSTIEVVPDRASIRERSSDYRRTLLEVDRGRRGRGRRMIFADAPWQSVSSSAGVVDS